MNNLQKDLLLPPPPYPGHYNHQHRGSHASFGSDSAIPSVKVQKIHCNFNYISIIYLILVEKCLAELLAGNGSGVLAPDLNPLACLKILPSQSFSYIQQ